MFKRLMRDDARAVDMILNRTAAANVGMPTFVEPMDDAVITRVGIVDSILRLLAEVPTEDPPTDLVQRTLERIKQNERTIAPASTIETDRILPMIDRTQPHA